MLFNSLSFLIFFPVTVAVFFILPQRIRKYFLLAASCYFYMAFIPSYILILAFTTVIEYFSARLIAKYNENVRVKRLIFVLCLVLNLLTVGIFKYLGFFGEIVNFFGRTLSLGTTVFPSIVLPIGISFHTFQALGYLIDVYRGNQPAEKNFIDFSLFLMFFPQLVAGPIERSGNLIAQVKAEHFLKHENVVNGGRKMLLGMFKKIVIADNLAVISDRVFGDIENFSGLYLLIGAVCFAFQIYCDFSGYTDIAIGAAEIMDFRLMKNFDTPYLSSSPAEFWRRWHISLSSWFRDYVYIPLGGNRVKKWRWALNMLITFALSGLWHGAAFTYIVWGALNGAYVVLDRITKKARDTVTARINSVFLNGAAKCFGVLFTFTLILISWVFFRAESFSDAFYIFGNVFSRSFADFTGITSLRMYVSVFSVFAIAAIDIFPKIYDFRKLPTALRLSVYIIAVVIIAVFGAYDNKSFIYFQF